MTFEQELIEAVKQHDILYNVQNKNFKRRQMKNAVWTEIAKQLNVSEKQCKTRWKNLRDRYLKVRRQGNTRFSSKNPTIPLHIRWRYYKELFFLNDYKIADTPLAIPNFNEDSSVKSCNEPTIEYESAQLSDGDEIMNVEVTASTSRNLTASRSEEIFETPVKKNETKIAFQDIDGKIYDFSAITSQQTGQQEENKGITQLFGLLAEKITAANLPSKAITRLEQQISNIVYETLLEYDN